MRPLIHCAWGGAEHQHHRHSRQQFFFIGRQRLKQKRPHHGVDIPKFRKAPRIRVGNQVEVQRRRPALADTAQVRNFLCRDRVSTLCKVAADILRIKPQVPFLDLIDAAGKKQPFPCAKNWETRDQYHMNPVRQVPADKQHEAGQHIAFHQVVIVNKKIAFPRGRKLTEQPQEFPLGGGVSGRPHFQHCLGKRGPCRPADVLGKVVPEFAQPAAEYAEPKGRAFLWNAPAKPAHGRRFPVSCRGHDSGQRIRRDPVQFVLQFGGNIDTVQWQLHCILLLRAAHFHPYRLTVLLRRCRQNPKGKPSIFLVFYHKKGRTA